MPLWRSIDETEHTAVAQVLHPWNSGDETVRTSIRDGLDYLEALDEIYFAFYTTVALSKEVSIYAITSFLIHILM